MRCTSRHHAQGTKCDVYCLSAGHATWALVGTRTEPGAHGTCCHRDQATGHVLAGSATGILAEAVAIITARGRDAGLCFQPIRAKPTDTLATEAAKLKKRDACNNVATFGPGRHARVAIEASESICRCRFGQFLPAWVSLEQAQLEEDEMSNEAQDPTGGRKAMGRACSDARYRHLVCKSASKRGTFARSA